MKPCFAWSVAEKLFLSCSCPPVPFQRNIITSRHAELWLMVNSLNTYDLANHLPGTFLASEPWKPCIPRNPSVPGKTRTIDHPIIFHILTEPEKPSPQCIPTLGYSFSVAKTISLGSAFWTHKTSRFYDTHTKPLTKPH